MKINRPSNQLQQSIVQREEHGACNICKVASKLTWDHVPPRGSIAITPMQQQTVLQHHATRHGGDHRYSISQNGVKFRTLCSTCNNTLLGSIHDPVLNDFTAQLTTNVTSTLILPQVIHINTSPRSLIRAVFGHILAAKGMTEQTVSDEAMREFFLNDTIVVPNGLKVFYWVHPYHNVIIIRDVAMPAIRGFVTKNIGFFSILKFFPIGFLVCNLDQYEGLNELTQYAKCQGTERITIPLNLRRVEHPRWPEIVDDSNFLAGGQSIQSSILAEPIRTGQP